MKRLLRNLNRALDCVFLTVLVLVIYYNWHV